jgi:hypothetical protein
MKGITQFCLVLILVITAGCSKNSGSSAPATATAPPTVVEKPPETSSKPQADDAKSVAALKALGAELEMDKDSQVIAVKCSLNKKIADADLAHLAGLPRVEIVWLADTAITDDGLPHLSKLPKLKQLTLAGTKVTDKGVDSLTSLKLERLIIFNTAVTDAKVEELKKKFGPRCDVIK